jgi:hypothetical protein
MSHDHKDKEPEELAVEAYMDQFTKSPEAPSDEERKTRYLERYKFIKNEAKRLQMDKEEIEATSSKNKEQLLQQVRAAFTENYKTRKAVVTELRKLGEKVEDQFIPLGAI